MSVLKQLESLGLMKELDDVLKEHAQNEEAITQLRAVIDEHGIKGPATMKEVTSLQRDGALTPGLYKKMVAVNKKLSEAPPPSEEESKVEEESSETSNEGEVKTSKGEVMSEEAKPVDVEDVDLGIDTSGLSERQIQKLKEQKKKDEEKARQQLQARFQKRIDRMRSSAEDKAKKKGMTPEQISAIKDKNEEISKLKEQAKEIKEQLKTAREELKALKPKREKKEKKDKKEKAA